MLVPSRMKKYYYLFENIRATPLLGPLSSAAARRAFRSARTCGSLGGELG
jgi:hypothetical protein